MCLDLFFKTTWYSVAALIFCLFLGSAYLNVQIQQTTLWKYILVKYSLIEYGNFSSGEEC